LFAYSFKESSNTIKHVLSSAARIAEAIQRKNPLTKAKIQEHINYKPALPLTVFKKLSKSELAKVAEIIPPISGMQIVTIPVRRYPHHETAAHIIGYIRTDDPSKAVDRDKYFYYIPDKRGVEGIEKAFDTEIRQGEIEIRGLRGAPGNSLVKVDFRGYVHTTIGTPIHGARGHDIVLTLNFKAQSIAEKLMKDKKGAMVLLDADTGAVLAMLSTPEYDISRFVPRLSGKYWRKLM
jgi:penicillin-binding protein 2